MPERLIEKPVRAKTRAAKKMPTTIAMLLSVALGFATATAVVTEADLQTKADDAYAAEQWQAAADAYASLVTEDSENTQNWYRYAATLRELGRSEEALVALDKAGLPPGQLAYEQARIYAGAREADQVFAHLDVAAMAGFSNLTALSAEPLFADYREDPRFEEAAAAIRANRFPCEQTESHAQFDFWVGSWDVYMNPRQLAGHNVIEKTEKGCLITEHWTGVQGSSGRSINYYDPQQDQWVQIWVAAGGYMIDIRGGLIDDGSMQLSGYIYYYPNATRADFRGTWTPLEDGRVRQFFEQSTDGVNWSPWFEGFYQRSE